MSTASEASRAAFSTEAVNTLISKGVTANTFVSQKDVCDKGFTECEASDRWDNQLHIPYYFDDFLVGFASKVLDHATESF